jgi:hypothetical protein
LQRDVFASGHEGKELVFVRLCRIDMQWRLLSRIRRSGTLSADGPDILTARRAQRILLITERYQ